MEERQIRVLSVDDSALVRRVIAQILQVQPDIDLVGEAADGQEAVRMAAELQPDIVLMDLYLPDLEGMAAISAVAQQLTHGAIVTVTAEEDPDVLGRAQTAGSQGYVLKPLGDGDELLRVARALHAQVRERRLAAEAAAAATAAAAPVHQGRCIAVVGAKGGVGKTTIAIGLGLALQRRHNSRVVMLDMDLAFGDLNIQLDLASERSILDLAGRMDRLDSDIVSQAIRHHSTGVHVLARPARPEEADVVTPDDVRAILPMLMSMYDYVVVDTAPSYDEKTLAVLDGADLYVVVLAPHMGALQNANHFLELAKVLGYSRDKMCFVLNRSNALAGLSFDLIAEAVGTRDMLAVPSGGVAVSEAINRGQPLTLSHPQSPFARALDGIASQVHNRATEENQAS